MADLVTPDLSAAEKFYGGLFGWRFQSVRAGDADYAVAMLDGAGGWRFDAKSHCAG